MDKEIINWKELLYPYEQTVEELIDATSEMLDFICEQIKFDYNSYHKKICRK